MSVVDAYDLVIFDLDGVVYVGDRPLPGAAEAIATLHKRQTAVAYATNNASRRAGEVADLLTGMGIPADATEVLTSAQAAAAALAERYPAESAILVIGAEALAAEVREVGLVPVASADAAPVAVVQGYGHDVGWAQLAEGCVAIRSGAAWYATNADATLPSDRGPLPGNGSLVAALRTATGREPDVVIGKPAPGLFTVAAARHRRALVVGDRLDTDIEGANRAGLDSMLVLTGVTTARMLLDAPAPLRPTYVASGLSTLDSASRIPAPAAEVTVAGWTARLDNGRLTLTGDGVPLNGLVVLCAAAWSDPRPPAELDARALQQLAELE